MNWYDKLKPVLKGIKWGVIAAVIASGWIMAAWIKADLKPSLGQLGQQWPPMILEPLKPTSGQQWLFNECVPVQYLADSVKHTSDKTRLALSRTPSQPGPSSGVQKNAGPISTPGQLTRLEGDSNGQVLPLGKFLIPAAGRDPLFATPLLDSQTGETTLRVEPAGGFARFGGERYAFMDASYQKLLQSDFELQDAPMLAIGIHQDLGRLGKLELMAEGWISGTLLQTPIGSRVELGVGAKLRVALPF